jgi:exoribonuclease R
MKSYKFVSYDREYKSWDIYDSVTLIEEEYSPDSTWKGFDPIKNKIFSGDVYEYDGEKVKILHSSVRNMPIIPGVLVLNSNQVYGKHKDKYLYKCVPDDKRLPAFLVPYNKRIEFIKKSTNKYIVFKHNHWLEKHPQGTIVNVLGDVEELECFYEYQLYCKSLYASIQQFTKAAMSKLKENTEKEYLQKMIKKYGLTDRTGENVFTIDSALTTDFDDAMSISLLCEETNTYRVSIYIANVSMWMEELSLWDSFSERIATIYLPDRKRPMLPTILSECMCSLCQGSIRIALCLDLVIMKNEILSYDFKNTYVNVRENYSYGSEKLERCEDYVTLLKVMKNLGSNPNYSYTTEIKNSYDLVSYTMILMNYYAACEMIKYKNGVYRSVTINKNVIIPTNLPASITGFLAHWHSSSGQYQIYDDKEKHDFLKLDNYVHITSPIRRLIDLLNMSILQNNLNISGKPTSPDYSNFLNKWLSRMEYINTTVRSIRKIQNDSNLLKHCLTEDLHNDDMIYEGYVFDKIKRNDGLFQYVVYLSSIKLVSRITIRLDFEEYCIQHFNILIFNDESSLKKKIRLAHIERSNEGVPNGC